MTPDLPPPSQDEVDLAASIDAMVAAHRVHLPEPEPFTIGHMLCRAEEAMLIAANEGNEALREPLVDVILGLRFLADNERLIRDALDRSLTIPAPLVEVLSHLDDIDGDLHGQLTYVIEQVFTSPGTD